MKNISVSSLKPGYSVFGNKGDVWSNTAHVYKNGVGALCGVPCLSSNHARIEGVKEIGCQECLKAYDTELFQLGYFHEILKAYPEFFHGNIYGKVIDRMLTISRKTENRLYSVDYNGKKFTVTVTVLFHATLTSDTVVNTFKTQAEVIDYLKFM